MTNHITLTEYKTRTARKAKPRVDYKAKFERDVALLDFHSRLKYLPHHPNAIGAAFRRAQLAGVIRRIGWQQSERAAAHARVVAVYLGAG